MGPGIPFAFVRPTTARPQAAPITAANRPGGITVTRAQTAVAGVPPVMHDARRDGDRLSRSKLAAVGITSIAHDAVEDLEALFLARMNVRARDRSSRHRQQLAHHTLGRMFDDARILAADGVVQHRSGGKLGTHVRRHDAMHTQARILSSRRARRYRFDDNERGPRGGNGAACRAMQQRASGTRGVANVPG